MTAAGRSAPRSQVEAGTGKVLQVGKRNDSMIEHLHDLQFWGGPLYDWVLPVVALCLLLLGLTGIYMFFVPVYRRWVFKRKGPPAKKTA